MQIAELLKQKGFLEITFMNDSGKLSVVVKAGELLCEQQWQMPISDSEVLLAVTKMGDKIIERFKRDANS